MKKWIKKILFDIYRLDKTPSYGYSKKDEDLDNVGNLAGIGKRWQTPHEIIQNTFRSAEIDFWTEYEEYLKKFKELK